MVQQRAIAIVGTFDSKGEEHLFLKDGIEKRGFRTLTLNVGTKSLSPFPADFDLYEDIKSDVPLNRDQAIQSARLRGQGLIKELYGKGEICGIISAGGGTGTHLATGIMHVLPLGVPKVMISTVASRNMGKIVGTKDITMIHSVVDLLGVNSISGRVLDSAAGAVCGMARKRWNPLTEKRCIALSFFGFITQAAEGIKKCLEEMGYEVIAFHANGTGGMAMEELAGEGYFHGILDLATHELADDMMDGYCGGIGPQRLEPVPGQNLPRLVVPGGLDCAVLEFTRDNIPDKYRDRKMFFYDFRSAIRLNEDETLILADRLAEKLNHDPLNTKMLIPFKGWSEADRDDGPLYDPGINESFVRRLKQNLNPGIEVKGADLHINDFSFAELAATVMNGMLLYPSN